MASRIIASYHHSFAGGSKNTSRLLHYASAQDVLVDGFFFALPQFFNYTQSRVNTYILSRVDTPSHVIQSNYLENYLLTDMVLKHIERLHDSEKIILFGANCFPYCNIMLDVKQHLQKIHGITAKLIIHPVGSDIWQIGWKMKERVKWLIEHEHVDHVMTYSETFSNEIREHFEINREIHVQAPILNTEEFCPLSFESKKERRDALGFEEDDFIIHYHSSMRAIKCPDVAIKIAQIATSKIKRNSILIMSGPIPDNLREKYPFREIQIDNTCRFLYESTLGRLKILWTDLIEDIKFLLQIADVEINTSLHDSFNISLLEAMACGIPVVTSDIVGIRNHILLSEGGICFQTKRLNFSDLNDAMLLPSNVNVFFNIEEASDAIVYLANNYKEAERIGLNGSKYVREKFNSDSVFREFQKLL